MYIIRLHFYFISINFSMKSYIGLLFIYLRIKQYHKSITPSNYLLNPVLLKPVCKLAVPYTKQIISY